MNNNSGATMRDVDEYTKGAVRMTISLTPELAAQVRYLAHHYNISYSSMIRRMVYQWMQRHPRKGAK